MPRARFPSVCPVCQQPITPGEEIVDTGLRGPQGGRKMGHARCGQARPNGVNWTRAYNNPMNNGIPAAFTIPSDWPPDAFRYARAPLLAGGSSYWPYSYEQFYRTNPQRELAVISHEFGAPLAFTGNRWVAVRGEETLSFVPGPRGMLILGTPGGRASYRNEDIGEFGGSRIADVLNQMRSEIGPRSSSRDRIANERKALIRAAQAAGIDSRTASRMKMDDLRSLAAKKNTGKPPKSIPLPYPVPVDMPQDAGPYLPGLFPTFGVGGRPMAYKNPASAAVEGSIRMGSNAELRRDVVSFTSRMEKAERQGDSWGVTWWGDRLSVAEDEIDRRKAAGKWEKPAKPAKPAKPGKVRKTRAKTNRGPRGGLDEAERKRLPDSAFLKPETRGWPVPDRRHAEIAIQYMTRGFGDTAEYPELIRKLAVHWSPADQKNRSIWSRYEKSRNQIQAVSKRPMPGLPELAYLAA